MSPPDLAELLPSWELALRAERKSSQTIKSYAAGVRQYLRWCSDNDRPVILDRHQLTGFVDSLLTSGLQPATARSRQLGVRRFSAWLVEEQEISTDPLLGVKAPKLDTQVIEPLTSAQLKALIKACASRDLRERRDEALLRFMFETGARAGEVAALAVGDINLAAGTAIVRRGKAARAALSRSAPKLRSHWTVTCVFAAVIVWPLPMVYGSGTEAKSSPTTGCASHWGCVLRWPG